MTPPKKLENSELRASVIPWMRALNSALTEIRFSTPNGMLRNFYPKGDGLQCLADIEKFDADPTTKAIYYSAHAIKAECIERMTETPIKKNDCVTNGDVTHFRQFPIDVDPPRNAVGFRL